MWIPTVFVYSWDVNRGLREGRFYDWEMARLPDPISRRDRQRQTREALVFTARSVFARDGYHGANLETIAREAGFSKGAVYSNFASKSALFLEVVDATNELAMGEGGWDVFERPPPREPGDRAAAESEEVRDAIKGFALATLEFIATAARDEELAAEMAKRMRTVASGYGAIAARSRPEGEHLPTEETGALLAALDQGAALLSLSGVTTIDQRVLRTGMQRLLDPARAAESAAAGLGSYDGDDDDHDDDRDDADGGPALHDRVMRDRIVAAAMGQAAALGDPTYEQGPPSNDPRSAP